MKILIVLFIALFFSYSLIAQIEQGSQIAYMSPNDEIPASDPCADACGAACTEACAEIFVEAMIVGGWELHNHHLDKKVDVPSVISIDLIPQIGTDIGNSFIMAPRVRGTWGLFTTDFRFFSLTEYDFGRPAYYYSSIDWQVLGLNLVSTKGFNLRLSGGFMYDMNEERFHPEYALMMDIKSENQRFITSIEGRLAHDTELDLLPRVETGIDQSFRLWKVKALQTYLTIGTKYQLYYPDVPYLLVMGGIRISIL